MGNFTKKDVLKYVGDTSQLFGIKDYRFAGGKADGVRAVDINNGTGLEFTVIPDRCLDIARLSFKGVNCSYIAKAGIVAPQYYNDRGLEFLRNFFAGFLTTCGLGNVGSPCVDNGEELGLHGRVSNIPAEEVQAGTEWTDDGPVMKVRGKMREARLFGENLILQREIVCKYGENKIYINDIVENNGFREEPLMILYHMNMGYPLLSAESYLVLPTLEVLARNEEAAKGINDYNKFQTPTPQYDEQVFYHDLKSDESGKTFAALINPVYELGVAIWFNKKQLGRLTEWKQMGEGDYVLGIEPCNCHVEGRIKEREYGTLEVIKPGEMRSFNIEIEMVTGQDRIKQLVEMI